MIKNQTQISIQKIKTKIKIQKKNLISWWNDLYWMFLLLLVILNEYEVSHICAATRTHAHFFSLTAAILSRSKCCCCYDLAYHWRSSGSTTCYNKLLYITRYRIVSAALRFSVCERVTWHSVQLLCYTHMAHGITCGFYSAYE